MEIKDGYKKTEIGVIPEDWEVKKLGEIGTVIRGASPRPQGDKRFYGGNVPRLMVEDVTRDGKFVTPMVDSLTEEGAKRSRPCIAGTLTIVCSGTVGIPAILAVDACIHDGFLALVKIKKEYSTDFLFYQLTTLREKFEQSATHGGVFTNLTTTVLKEFEVSFPKYEEQTRIANILSDTDNLIQALEKRIAKKCLIKQGAMQKLLTPKEDWEVKKLGEIAEIDQDNLGADTSPNYTFHYISLEDVDFGVLKNTTELVFREAPSRARRKIKKGDILLSTVRPNLKSHLLITENVPDWICSTGFSVLRCKDKIAYCEYVFHHLFASFINNQIETLISGSNYPAINSKDVKSLQIPLPTLETQNHIAIILSDMDAEIETLEKKLAKYKQLKQGLMQNLLTGKMRLI